LLCNLAVYFILLLKK